MTLIQALILGLVEGVTEFLPISSTGHLILAQWLLGLEGNQAVNDFNIIVQGGAILAVLGLYWSSVVRMVRGLLGRDAGGRRLALNTCIAFLPAACIGVVLDNWIEAHLFHPGPVIGALVAGGIVLILIGPWQRRLLHLDRETAGGSWTELENLTWKQAFVIGLLQCLAMWPGTSRSMVTIVGGMLVGLKPKHAAEFSFILGLPTLGGACVYKLAKHMRGGFPQFVDQLGGPLVMLLGLAIACISAAIAIRWLVAFLNRHGLSVFGWYRIALGGILAIAISARWISISPPDSAQSVHDSARQQIAIAHPDGLAQTRLEYLAQLGDAAIAGSHRVR